MSNIVIFEGHELDKIYANGGIWLRGSQIGTTLGFIFPEGGIRKLYNRNKHQFTDDMTNQIILDTAGGKQLSRVFSPRGAALLALLAKTPIADRFRAFVLDKLESKTRTIENFTILEQEFLKARPDLHNLLRYSQMELSAQEIQHLMGLKETAIRRRKRLLESCGLMEPPYNLARMQEMAYQNLNSRRLNHA